MALWLVIPNIVKLGGQSVRDVVVNEIQSGAVIVYCTDSSQPFSSVTIAVYVPAETAKGSIVCQSVT